MGAKKSEIKRNQRRNAVVVVVNYSINERHVQYEKNKHIVYVFISRNVCYKNS